MSKRILVYSTQLLETGGIESHINEFCLNVGGKEVEIDLLVWASSVTEETKTRLSRVCNKLFLGKKGGITGIVWLILVLLRLSSLKYNALYTNGQGNSIYLLSLLVRRNKWVHHHHTSGDKADQSTWTKWYRKAMQKADILIACAHKNADRMSMVLGRKINVITCFSRKVDLLLPSIGKSKKSDKIRLGYFGRLIPEKGIEHLCALSKEPELLDTEFHIWGIGESYSEEFFLEFPNVYYHGAFYGEEGLRSALQTIHAYLLISTHPEGLPISLLETMSCGIPWLATDQGGISDIAIAPGATRLLSADSGYWEIKKAVFELSRDLKNGEIDTENLKRFYDTNFSQFVLTKRWLSCLLYE